MINFPASELRHRFTMYFAQRAAQEKLWKGSMRCSGHSRSHSFWCDDGQNGWLCFRQETGWTERHSHIPLIFSNVAKSTRWQTEGAEVECNGLYFKTFLLWRIGAKRLKLFWITSVSSKSYLNTSIARLQTLKNLEADGPPTTSPSKFEENCKLPSLPPGKSR